MKPLNGPVGAKLERLKRLRKLELEQLVEPVQPIPLTPPAERDHTYRMAYERPIYCQVSAR